MTQEEVDAIYEYLHENYEYSDGELITKKDIPNGHRAGVSVGEMYISEKGKSFIRTHLNKFNCTLSLGHLIFIYHYKRKAKYLVFNDKNPMNTSIDNLKERNSSPINTYSYSKNKPNGFQKRKDGKNGVFTVKVRATGKQFYIGSFECEKIAKKAYIYASKLWEKGSLTREEWITKVREKYPLRSREKYIRTFDRDLPIGVLAHGNRFRSSISFHSKKRHLGVFDTPEEAHAAYLKAKEEYSETNA